VAAILTFLLAPRVFPAVAGTGDPRWPKGVVNVYDASGMTDTMITAAAEAVAAFSDARMPGASLLPPVTNLRTVSAAVAIAVAQAAEKEGLAQAPLNNLVQQVYHAMWRPQYPSFEAI